MQGTLMEPDKTFLPLFAERLSSSMSLVKFSITHRFCIPHALSDLKLRTLRVLNPELSEYPRRVILVILINVRFQNIYIACTGSVL